MKSQKVGDIVPLGADIYMIQKIENGWVYLRQPNARGKQKKLYWREVPYFEEGKLMPAHFRPIYYNHNYRYFEEDQNDYARKESIWIHDDRERWERELDE